MERLNQVDYFEEALRLMAEGGAKSVTIANLCRGLAVTKGSFYYHFDSIRTFTRQFLLYWEDAYSLRYIDQAHAIQDPAQRLDYLFRMASRFHHEAERAIRGYASTDPYAAEMQERVDQARTEVVSESLQALGLTAGRADVAARFALAVLVGAQQTIRPPSPRAVQRMLEACALSIQGTTGRSVPLQVPT